MWKTCVSTAALPLDKKCLAACSTVFIGKIDGRGAAHQVSTLSDAGGSPAIKGKP
jgi:hypothetical protein